MSNGTEKPIDKYSWVKVKIEPGKATKYDGKEYVAGDACMMQKYVADAHCLAGICKIVSVVENYDPTRVEPVVLDVPTPD